MPNSTTPTPHATGSVSDDPFRRVVAKAAQRPPTPARTAPPSTYTQDVIARGSAAVRDRAAGATIDSTRPNDKLDWVQSTGYGAAPTEAYQKWLGQRGFQPQYTPTFGQTTGKKAGPYDGFKTEGELKAAILGRADQARMADQASAADSYRGASALLDNVTGQYDKLHGQTATELAAAAGQGASLGLGHVVPAKHGGIGPLNAVIDAAHALAPPAVETVGPTAEETQQAQYGLDRASQLGDYDNQLKQWLATQSQQPIDDMETARQIGSTPLRQYASLAGADYGVDPALIAGWYPQSSDVGDFNSQQNLQSIQDYGVPLSQFNQWQTQQAQQQATTARTATADQTAADKQATIDATAQTQQIVSDATGLDANQLGQAVNMTPDQVAQVVSDPNYVQASTDLADALGITDNADYADLSDKDRQDAVTAVVEQVKRDPAMYAILKQVYGSYATF